MRVGMYPSTKTFSRELARSADTLYASRMDGSFLASNIRALRQSLGLNQASFAERFGAKQFQVSKWEAGQEPAGRTLSEMAAVAGVTVSQFIDEIWSAKPPKNPEADDIVTVGIQHIDQAYGMGAVFTEGHVDVEVLQFPKRWVETITYSPPALLTWMRGKGDSMFPTICDGDLVLIDRSHTKVKEQDAIWAFTVGDVGSIKRLRVKGDRFVILSDNSSVPPDEEPIDFVRVVGRVAFVGAKK